MPKKRKKKKKGQKNPAIAAVHSVMRKKKVMTSLNTRRPQNRQRRDVKEELGDL